MTTEAYMNACRYPSATRVYFYDLDTREELAEYADTGRLEMGIRDGARYTDTCMGVAVVDHEARDVRVISAEDFPGRRVAVKFWAPRGHWKGQDANEENVSWAFLPCKANGWAGNEASVGKGPLPRKTLGRAARKEPAAR